MFIAASVYADGEEYASPEYLQFAAYYKEMGALVDAACSGDDAAVRAELSKDRDTELKKQEYIDDLTARREKTRKKALKCAIKKGYKNIISLIERDQAGEHIMSVAEDAKAVRQKAEQDAVMADEKTGMAAESAGKIQEAFKWYQKALQGLAPDSPGDLGARIRERLINVARRLSPPPSVPDKAIRFLKRGMAIIKTAEAQDDFERAESELSQAVYIAPWWGDAYFNRGLIREKMGHLTEAIYDFKTYLMASPDAMDAANVGDKIITLEVQAEKMSAKPAKAEIKREKRPESNFP
jgi:tetratricopeptide (TPR) repeat protein